MNGLNEAVQRLADLEAIRDLACRYAHYIWRGQPLRAVDLFAENGVMDMGDEGIIRGKAELRAVYSEKVSDKMLLHPFVHNHVIDLYPGENGFTEEGEGTCYLDLRCVRNGQSLMGSGYYNDRYVREVGTWKFKFRKLNMCYLVPPTDGWL